VPREVLPFDHLDLGKRRNNKSDNRLPFPPADIPKLVKAASDDPQLADLITLAAYSGCRIEELCALKLDHVAEDHFKITDAKTAAGIREVPIHKAIAKTVARLRTASGDGYLLAGLTENKYGDRSNAIGKRFGRLKRDLGYDARYVFHSIRKTVSTALENAGVPENVAADILGHEKPRITYGLYSGGVSLAVKAEALGKLVY
jgi:integrase